MFIPIIYDIVPCQIGPNSMDGREFGFSGCEEPSMLEAHNVPFLEVMSPSEFHIVWIGFECHSIGPIDDP